MPMRPQADEASQEESEYELYKIYGEESHIGGLLRLIYKCLAYDFQHNFRTFHEDYKQMLSSQIILPTKFSKFSKFQEFDIFLRQEHVAEMLNYLFIALRNPNTKLVIVKLLATMARIHFRYFKNKLAHRLFLENLLLVISNLIIALDFGAGESLQI